MCVRLILSALLAAGLMLACGGGGGRSTPVPATGNLSLRLGSDSLPGYSQAVVSLEKVEAYNGGAWVTLGNVQRTVDLQALQNGQSTLILSPTVVGAGTYTQFRLTWATVNYQSAINLPAYVVQSGTTGQVLTMPTSTVVNAAVTVPASGSTVAQIMLSGQQAVQSRTNGTVTFQATGTAYDLSTSARIVGHLAEGTAPLAGAEVFAESVDGLGVATLQRRALSDSAGNYALEGLTMGTLCYVVAQPAGGTSAYAAVAAAPVNAATATTYTANLSFGAPVTPGALALTITPASSTTQGTWGELRQTLATGSIGSQNLIVRSQTVATGPTTDQVVFTGLASAIYGVTAGRSLSGAAPVVKAGAQVVVSAGATAPSSLSFP